MFYYLKTNKSILEEEINKNLSDVSVEFPNIVGLYKDNCSYTHINNDEVLVNVGFYNKNGSTYRKHYPNEEEVQVWRDTFGEENILNQEQASGFFPTDV